MKKLISIPFLLFILTIATAQKVSKLPESKLPSIETETHLRFLASDEMLGRKTGEPTNNVAARYIAEQFRYCGLKMPAGQSTYLQAVPFSNTKPVTEGSIATDTALLKAVDDFLVIEGQGIDIKNVPLVFANFGWVDEKEGYDDYKDLDVKGKVVVVSLGTPKSEKTFEMMSASSQKTKFAAQHGALAVIEIFTAKVGWKQLTRYFNSERLELNDTKTENTEGITHVWISQARATAFAKDRLKTVSIKTGGRTKTAVMSYNVAGVLEGSDPVLKNEYIILSAHFDHLGTAKGTGKVGEDTIYNGTRDNAFGCSALLFAAKCLSQVHPKRSILFLGLTGEEIGLLGSEYYAEHPLIPLKQCVFNLDTDGAGYNDTTKLTTIGLNRTDATPELMAGAKAFGLNMIDDPAPEQNLFDRSDNVNFAKKGIPAPDYSPGLKAFDEAIFKYYHKTEDNVETVSLTYFHRYCQSFTYTARLIANRKNAPKWTPGDKYEPAFKALYGK